MKNTVDKRAVGARIRKIRLEKGMTLEEFGKLMDADKGIVSRWEHGASLPKAERLKTIAKLGDMSVEELLHGKVSDFLKDKKDHEVFLDTTFLHWILNEPIDFYLLDEIDNFLETKEFTHLYGVDVGFYLYIKQNNIKISSTSDFKEPFGDFLLNRVHAFNMFINTDNNGANGQYLTNVTITNGIIVDYLRKNYPEKFATLFSPTTTP